MFTTGYVYFTYKIEMYLTTMTDGKPKLPETFRSHTRGTPAPAVSSHVPASDDHWCHAATGAIIRRSPAARPRGCSGKITSRFTASGPTTETEREPSLFFGQGKSRKLGRAGEGGGGLTSKKVSQFSTTTKNKLKRNERKLPLCLLLLLLTVLSYHVPVLMILILILYCTRYTITRVWEGGK